MNKMKALFISLLFLSISCTQIIEPWPDGKIKFVFVSVPELEQRAILNAMLSWEIATIGLIKFVPSDEIGPGILYIFINDNLGHVSGGMANRGYTPDGYRSVIFNGKYFYDTILLHELGHVIGLEDDYIMRDSIMYYIFDGDYEKQISAQDVFNVDYFYDKEKL